MRVFFRNLKLANLDAYMAVGKDLGETMGQPTPSRMQYQAVAEDCRGAKEEMKVTIWHPAVR